ncbi:BolA family transcriptional regulator [Leptospira perolatii]|uniref:BolA family transcriptional regulator n=1 Tax=Leptospira perolatii TaxID=2023191 RepID=A0A2M9ZJT9_9LEPT|nr:BolA family protein [Leptospira perolatii]PJZ68601.1 BolA family transcriptional regulator [Leptospira perolatii]PJZ72310.1 BolA family transcriptional regulator [Leptospira perolatii]
MENALRSLLEREFEPEILEIHDFSAEHAGHTGNPDSLPSGTHIRIFIRSRHFSNLDLLTQHRKVFNLLKEFISASGIHALELRTEAA